MLMQRLSDRYATFVRLLRHVLYDSYTRDNIGPTTVVRRLCMRPTRLLRDGLVTRLCVREGCLILRRTVTRGAALLFVSWWFAGYATVTVYHLR